jgi:hypothetical protein
MSMSNMLRSGDCAHFGLTISPHFGDSLSQAIMNTFPDIGWLVMLCAPIFLYVSLLPNPANGPR